MRKKHSILFIRPDYHCSFFYRDELRKLDWKADIYVPWEYPENLLYSDQGILRPPKITQKHGRLLRYINHLLLILWWLSRFWRYEYHFYYGRPPAVTSMEKRLGMTKLFGSNFLVECWLSRLFKTKLLYLPTGCHDEETQLNFSQLDNGNVCNNCGLFDRCNDTVNNLNFSRIRHYFDITIGPGSVDSTQYSARYIKYKSINLSLWSPEIDIPPQHRLPPTRNLRILHSAYLEESGRTWGSRNIKGSPFVLAAIEKLKAEGHAVEYLYISDKPSNQMRFYQAQADIVVEQLIYGSWGSTGVETMALGKPVVCYIRPSWKEFFFRVFPEYKELPIVEANTQTIYEVLKRLVTDEAYRLQKGKESRRFSEQHFDPVKNTLGLIALLESLQPCAASQDNYL